jgi:hypothetical protein
MSEVLVLLRVDYKQWRLRLYLLLVMLLVMLEVRVNGSDRCAWGDQ